MEVFEVVGFILIIGFVIGIMVLQCNTVEELVSKSMYRMMIKRYPVFSESFIATVCSFLEFKMKYNEANTYDKVTINIFDGLIGDELLDYFKNFDLEESDIDSLFDFLDNAVIKKWLIYDYDYDVIDKFFSLLEDTIMCPDLGEAFLEGVILECCEHCDEVIDLDPSDELYEYCNNLRICPKCKKERES